MHFNCHNFAKILIILKKMSTKLGVAFEDESIEVEISLAAKLLMQDFQIYLKKPFFLLPLQDRILSLQTLIP